MAACNTELIGSHRMCDAEPAEPFHAVCPCGHEIAGTACHTCRESKTPGCLTCWSKGAGHICIVTFSAEVTQ